METGQALERVSRMLTNGYTYRGAVVGYRGGVGSDLPVFGGAAVDASRAPGGAVGSAPRKDSPGEEWRTMVSAPPTVSRPVSPDESQVARRKSVRLRRAQNVMARMMGGLGATIEPAEAEERATGVVSAETRAEQEEHGAWLEEVNPEQSLSELYEALMLDRLAIGDCFYAIRPDSNGRPSELYQLASRSVYAMREVYAGDQGPMGFVRYYTDTQGNTAHECYKRLGVPGAMSRKTGKIAGPVADADDLALEAVQRKTYDPESEIYGVGNTAHRETVDTGYVNWLRVINWLWRSPGWIAAAIARGMDKPTFEKVCAQVETGSSGLYGVGKMLNLNSPRPDFGMRADSSSIQVQQFGSGLPETEHLLAIDERVDQKVSEGYGLFDIFLGSSKDGARSASVVRQIFYELEVEPILQREEAHFTRAILRRRGAKRVKLKFRRPSITDAYQHSQIVARLNQHRVLPANDVIRLINQTVPGADFGLLPAPWGTTPVFLLQIFASSLTAVTARTIASGGDSGDGADPITMTGLLEEASATFAAVMRATRDAPGPLQEAGVAPLPPLA